MATSIYLNNASTGPLPARAVAAVTGWTRRRAEPFRLRDPELVAVLAHARALAAQLIGADAGEIALMTNTIVRAEPRRPRAAAAGG